MEFNGEISTEQNINCGVPQGSILGPLLFIIYINDLCLYMNPTKCILYADDTTFIASDKSLDKLRADTDLITQKAEDWFTYNRLMLNKEKTQSLIISTNRGISRGHSVKLLGITVDDRLSWAEHVEDLRCKLVGIIFLLRRLRAFVGAEMLRACYFGLFHSRTSYGVILWGNSAHALTVFRLQKKAIRVLANVNSRTHCRPLFKAYGIMPLPCLYVYHTLIEIHRQRNSMTSSNDMHRYNVRNNLLCIKRYRLTTSKNNSLNLQLYNILPSDFQALDCARFKQGIKKLLLTYCFYSVEEYLNSRSLF